MKKDNRGSITIIYVESGDEKQVIQDALNVSQEQREAIVIVLPNQPTRAFQSPRDFNDLKYRKRQRDLPIVFVIANERLAQWARMNGFSVYPSLSAIIKTPKEKSFAASQYEVDERYLNDSLAMPSYSPQGYPSLDTYQPQEKQQARRISDPVTPLPPTHDPITPFPPGPDDDYSYYAGIFPGEQKQNEQPANYTSNTPFAPSLPHTPSTPLKQKHSPWLLPILIIVLIGVVFSGMLLFSQRGAILHTTASHTTQAVLPATDVGSVFFRSSGQLDQMGTVGMNDIIEISLHHLAQPASGKSYYVWLRGDSNLSDGAVILLGTLNVSPQGTASMVYSDPQHTNLLMSMSRILITEESASVVPALPSPDTATWRYTGGISQTPNPNDSNHFSLLDHLRHLLAAEPSLETRGLHGGLALWMYRNTEKLLEWTRNIQDDQGNPQAAALMQRQVIHTLDYLDGINDVAADVPAHTPIEVDHVQGSVGLLQLHAYQDPAAYVQQIGYHLIGMLSSPGVSASQRQIAIQLHSALDAVNQYLTNARKDAKQLAAMSNAQLQQPTAKTLANDLFTQVNNAYVGTMDPATGNQQHGVDWLYNTMHTLATIAVQTYRQ